MSVRRKDWSNPWQPDYAPEQGWNPVMPDGR
jgi:hypothetical protein